MGSAGYVKRKLFMNKTENKEKLLILMKKKKASWKHGALLTLSWVLPLSLLIGCSTAPADRADDVSYANGIVTKKEPSANEKCDAADRQ